MPNYTYRSEYVRCGKAGCKSCPHGPYWYGYWKQDGRTRKRYFGKVDPSGAGADRKVKTRDDRWDAINNNQTASLDLALEILGLTVDVSFTAARTRARQLLMEHHPDRGGQQRRYSQVNNAWSYLRCVKDWK